MDTGWFGRMEPWGLAMVAGGGAWVNAGGAALVIGGGATLGVLDGVGTGVGPVLFWPGPTVVRPPD